jgi:hypothetical protein
MQALDQAREMSPELERFSLTSALPPTRISGEADPNSAARAKWQHWMDHCLIEWGRNPALLDEDGEEPPTVKTVQTAFQIARACRDQGCPAPDVVVVDPNGGIVFVNSFGTTQHKLRVGEDGRIEYLAFEGGRLIARDRLW